MYQLHTAKQRQYFDEVIRLHYEEGYGENRISQLLPIGHTTASRWIAIFAKEKGKIFGTNDMRKPQENASSQVASDDVARLQERVKELEAQLLRAEIKAEAYDEMINVAEAKFRIPIRKKAGAKQ
jgi:transposase